MGASAGVLSRRIQHFYRPGASGAGGAGPGSQASPRASAVLIAANAAGRSLGRSVSIPCAGRGGEAIAEVRRTARIAHSKCASRAGANGLLELVEIFFPFRLAPTGARLIEILLGIEPKELGRRQA
jgi:hypothetical protein